MNNSVRAYARHSDPQTSHEAAKTVNVSRGQRLILEAVKTLKEPFTDKQLVQHYRVLDLMGEVPTMSESGIRSRRSELVRLGYLKHAGFKNGVRRENLWARA